MIRFAHIPKTSGYSLYTEFHPPKYNFSKSETCLPLWHIGTNDVINAAMFRKPEQQVFSQYKECRFDGWGKKTTARTQFPRKAPIMKDFETWLTHFDESQQDDYNCYHPYNMQTRCTFCLNESHCHHNLNRWPTQTVVIRNSLKSIDNLQWVGVQDLYHESVCVLYWKLQGHLPRTCDCERAHKYSHPYIRHNVPLMNVSFSLRTLDLIRNFTQYDRIIYKYAYTRAVSDILSVQNLTRRFWCTRPVISD